MAPVETRHMEGQSLVSGAGMSVPMRSLEGQAWDGLAQSLGGVRCGGLRRPSQGFWIDPYSHASATDDLLTCPLSCSFPARVSVGFTVPVTVKAVGFRRSLPWLPRQSATTLAAFLLSLGSGNQQSEVSAWVGRERESLPGFPPSFCWLSGNLWSSLAYGH